MDFTALALPASYLFIGWLLLAWLSWRWLASGDWRRLAEPGRANLFLGATVVALAIWQVRAGIKPGLSFHLFGITTLTLMFGYWRAWVAGVIVLAANAAFGRGSFAALGLDALLSVALPAWISWQFMRLLEKKLPRHFFIYAFGSGFFGAALAIVAVGLATTLVMAMSGAYTTEYLYENYTPYMLLMMSWAEAFSTGMAVTLMAVYRPHWLETYDERATLNER